MDSRKGSVAVWPYDQKDIKGQLLKIHQACYNYIDNSLELAI